MKTIEVTEDDILLGKPGNQGCCALALALKRHFPDAGAIEVMDTGFQIGPRTLSLPLGVRSFMIDFDNGEECLPFTFQLP